MKVLEVTPLNQDTDNPSWRVKLEGDSKPLWIFKTKPQFVAGYDIPGEKIKLSSKGTSYIWNYQGGQAQTQQETPKPTEVKPSYGKHSTKDSEVETSKRCALMTAERLYGHSTDPGVPLDKEQFTTLYNYCCALIGVDNPLVEAIKKEGGVEK